MCHAGHFLMRLLSLSLDTEQREESVPDKLPGDSPWGAAVLTRHRAGTARVRAGLSLLGAALSGLHTGAGPLFQG